MQQYLAFVKPTVVLLLCLCTMGYISGCDADTVLTPSGEIASKEQPLTQNINKIEIANGFRLEFTQEDRYNLEVRTFENLLTSVIVETSGSTLKVYRKDRVEFVGSPDVIIKVSLPALQSVIGSGGSRLQFKNTVTGGQLAVTLSGGSRIEGKANLTGTLQIEQSGGSRAEIEGNANALDIESSGGSETAMFDFPATTVKVEISGGGKADVNVLGTLRVRASGGSKVRYKGNGTVAESNLSGGSTLEQSN